MAQSSKNDNVPSGEDMQKLLLKNFSIASGSKFMEGNNVPYAMECLIQADAVCFDVDSTVISEEGIDVLADFLGKGEAVAELTRQAMDGSTKFQDALAERLQLLQPSREDVQRCLQEHPFQLTPGIEEFCETLTMNGVDIYLVSGGFRDMIEPVAMKLCIAKDRIVANTILYEDDEFGTYKGFDRNEPTSADMGKPKALQQIKKAANYETMVMIGDGATDAQAKPPADAFIGFGGVEIREAAREQADWFVLDFSHLNFISKKFGKNKLRK